MMVFSTDQRHELVAILNALNPGAIYSASQLVAEDDPARDPDGLAILKNPVRWNKEKGRKKGFHETLSTAFALAELRRLMQLQTGNLTNAINFIFRSAIGAEK